MDYNELRKIVASCIEGPEQSINFRLNMYKLTRLSEVLGLIPLFYKNHFLSKEITAEDMPFIAEYCKGNDLLWFDENKAFLTCIFVRQEDMDTDLQNYLQNILRLRIEQKKDKHPFCHDHVNHHHDCYYKESNDIIDIISKIVSKYPCHMCFIAKAVTTQNILLNIRFRPNSVLSEIEKEENGEMSYPAKVEQEGKVIYYNSLSEAIDAVEEGGEITITSDINLDAPIEITKSMTIKAPEGKNFTISTNDGFEQTEGTGELIGIRTNANVTLKNLTINSNGKTRGIYTDKGSLTVENCIITGNKYKSYPGGVYLTKAVECTFINSTITGNEVGDDYAEDEIIGFTKDIWVGTNAKCTMQSTKVGNMFVNANSYSATDKGMLVFDGNVIDTLYLEYADGYGADMLYKKGVIKKMLMMASDGSSVVEYTDGLEPDTTYSGGDIDVKDIVVVNPNNCNCGKISMYKNMGSAYEAGR
ncbi:MAG: right-handed parallel beta-helix repeat-containing protein [Lachnospiraceae bacterium]|nr:right-handed parallel beta-helix repeat-containing protein [Lachnospiraceae bacterium]